MFALLVFQIQRLVSIIKAVVVLPCFPARAALTTLQTREGLNGYWLEVS